MKVWIQHADFAEDEYDLDLDSTLKLFADVDWVTERALEQELAKNGDDHCPPGLGIDHPTDRILHICPGLSGALVHFHYPHKAMGFLSRQKSITLEKVPSDQTKRMIHAFFEEKWDVLSDT